MPSSGSCHQCAFTSLCPRSLDGSTMSRTRCLSTFASGKPPSALRSQICVSPTRTRNTPPPDPLDGTRATLRSSRASSSLALQKVLKSLSREISSRGSQRGAYCACMQCNWSLCWVCREQTGSGSSHALLRHPRRPEVPLAPLHVHARRPHSP